MKRYGVIWSEEWPRKSEMHACGPVHFLRDDTRANKTSMLPYKSGERWSYVMLNFAKCLLRFA